METLPISVIILTKNEEKNLERCFDSVSFAKEIIVIDDNSQDNTIAIAKKHQARILQRSLDGNFSLQRNTALTLAQFPWILFIDADEVVSPELSHAIKNMLASSKPLPAYYIRRREFYLGHEVKFGEVRRVRERGLIRLMQQGSGRWIGDVHEEYIPQDATRVGLLQGLLDHFPHQNLKIFLADINRYSTLRAKELYRHKVPIRIWEIVAYPFGKFLYTCIWLQGYRDGAHGFIYSFMMSFHSFLVRTKLYQYTYFR